MEAELQVTTIGSMHRVSQRLTMDTRDSQLALDGRQACMQLNHQSFVYSSAKCGRVGEAVVHGRQTGALPKRQIGSAEGDRKG